MGSAPGLPLHLKDPDANKKESDETKHLLSAFDLKERTPKFNFNTVSLHMIDQGYGPYSLVTFHKFEDEIPVNKEAVKWSPEQKSDAGIIGRILAGTRRKLCAVI